MPRARACAHARNARTAFAPAAPPRYPGPLNYLPTYPPRTFPRRTVPSLIPAVCGADEKFREAATAASVRRVLPGQSHGAARARARGPMDSPFRAAHPASCLPTEGIICQQVAGARCGGRREKKPKARSFDARALRGWEDNFVFPRGEREAHLRVWGKLSNGDTRYPTKIRSEYYFSTFTYYIWMYICGRDC